ncbi:cytochrome P450 [Aspergillus novofumigatus IBT 16806]|uniref:Cytochrome P450 n=1 Tax=Aspergillus novofumigatus (strain IBT 16806) TaxID=1392255 RepID=A0A2I1BVS8_ASPN1|nr:cytochrome P450 [Aspergillus novofumigatus IBT 16806]PKX89465.1 cytochrome P450 [Aspergillus novofumigatus IBT 16806]
MAPNLLQIMPEMTIVSTAYLKIGLISILPFRSGLVIWRLLFHPLAGFPGPKLYAASYLPFVIQNQLKGKFVKDILKILEKYGPIVVPQSYGSGDRIGMLPSRLEGHRGINQTYVDLLITRLGEACEADLPVDVTRWFNYLNFDIIGELTFGDPFYSLVKSCDYHPWIAKLFSNRRAIATMLFFDNYPILRALILIFVAKHIRNRAESEELARVKTAKILALGTDARRDFSTHILRHDKDGTGMTEEEKIPNAWALLVAGSETSAMTLSGLIFQLSLNREIYDILTREIRGAFSAEEQINVKFTASLQFLRACLEETLRIYPPPGETTPRLSPGDFVHGHCVPKGSYVSLYQWATHHSPRNFIDPDSFNPQRFLPAAHPLFETRYSSIIKQHSSRFLLGLRTALKKNLAYAELHLVFARLLWKFDR